MGSLKKSRSEELGHEIVECPACNTKFAVEAHVIAAHEVPRFHCSRCDHIFERELRRRSDVGLVPPLSNEKVEAPDRSDEELDGEPFPMPGRSLQIPRSFEPSFSASAPQEGIGQNGEPSNQLELSLGQRRLDLAPQPAARIPVAKETAPLRPASSPPAAQPGPSQPKAAAPAEDRSQRFSLPELDLDDDRPSFFARITQGMRGEEGWNGLAVILSPLFAFFLALLAVSYYCQTNPAAAIEFSSKILPSAPRLAPAGLHIARSRFKKVALESGDVVAVVSGAVMNSTESAYSDVLLEGLMFDDSGRTISSLKVPLGSDLAKARLKSMTLEMIDELQAAKPNRKLELKPGREAEFSVALTGDQIKEAKYFAARIYSVR